jgi:hypothetical protein
MSHVRRINAIENRQNQTTCCLETVNDVDKFVQTKRRRSIVDREHGYGNPGLFNVLE